jgi:predicted dehydrogenase
VAGEWGIDSHGSELAEVADQVDAVVACNPSGCHGVVAQQAAALGLHVLVEKPLDISGDAMDAAITACAAANVRLGVAYQRRTRPMNRALKAMIDDGALGRLLAVDLSLKFYRGNDYYDSAAWRGSRELDGGGPFMQQASHDLDLLCWLVGKPHAAQALLGTLAHEGLPVEDHGGALLSLPGGAIATVVASTICAPGFPPRMDLFFSKGTISLVNDRIELWQVDGVERPDEGAASGHDASTQVAVSDTSAHEALIADFVDAVSQERPPIADGASARMATDTVLAIYAAARASGTIVF